MAWQINAWGGNHSLIVARVEIPSDSDIAMIIVFLQRHLHEIYKLLTGGALFKSIRVVVGYKKTLTTTGTYMFNLLFFIVMFTMMIPID